MDSTRATEAQLVAAFLLPYIITPTSMAGVYTLEWLIGRMTGTAVYPYPWPKLAAMSLISVPGAILLCRKGRLSSGFRMIRANSSVPLASAVPAVALMILIWKPMKWDYYFDSEYSGSAPYPWRGLLYLTGIGLLLMTLGTYLYLIMRNWKTLTRKKG